LLECHPYYLFQKTYIRNLNVRKAGIRLLIVLGANHHSAVSRPNLNLRPRVSNCFVGPEKLVFDEGNPIIPDGSLSKVDF